MFPPAKVYCYCLVQELKASYAWHIPDPSVHWCFLHMVDSGIITIMHSHLCIHIYVVCRFYKYIHLCYDQPVYVYPSLFHVESSNLRTCMPKMYKPITLMPHTHGLPCFAHVLHVLPTAYLFYDSSSWLALPLILLSMHGRYWSYYLYTLKSMFPRKNVHMRWSLPSYISVCIPMTPYSNWFGKMTWAVLVTSIFSTGLT